ncbi:MAG: thiamine pyrophosphate-dependent enzyme [Candidatus Sericytochromatia bacterium]|nr:thiamine pyrophosphate-dependent enzyme [Candidatus Sericytochromatia bacterium]
MTPEIHTPQGLPEVRRVLGPGDEAPSVAALPKDDLLDMLGVMIRTRVLDGRLRQAHRQGRIAFHLPQEGSETVSAALALGLADQDWLFPGSRDLAALLQRGVPAEDIAHAAYANAASCSKGRALPIFFSDKARRIAPTGATGATHLVHATGAAWAARLQGLPGIAVAAFADGALASGELHAAFNIASVQRCGVVFVCHNRTGLPLGDLGSGYAFPTHTVDASDALALREALAMAMDRAREGRGPSLVDAVYPMPVTTAAGTEPAPDGLVRLRRHLEGLGLWTSARDQQCHAEALASAEAALAAAAAVPAPDPATLLTDLPGA